MPRDGSNVYTIPWPDFVAGTVIESAKVDANNADMVTDHNAITNGTLPWTAAFKAAVGTVALPGITFNGDSNTGWWWVSADSVALSLGGVLSWTYAAGVSTFSMTDAGATVGPVLRLHRDSATPAVNDIIGKVQFDGEDSAGNQQEYANIFASIVSPTSTTEQSALHAQVITGGAMVTVLEANALGLSVGGATAASGYSIHRTIDTGYVSYGGGSGDDEAILIYGGSHATLAGDIILLSDGVTRYQYDFSTLTHTFTGAVALSSTLSYVKGAITTDTYTPTMTAVANVAAAVGAVSNWSQNGNMVTVSGTFTLDPTTTLTLTELGISLPVASNIGAISDLAGTAVPVNTVFGAYAIYGDAANNRAMLSGICQTASNLTHSFTFQYRVI